MSRFVRVSPSIHTKESRTWPAILNAAPRGPLWMSANYAAYAKEGYTWCDAVYSCINASYRTFYGMDWGVFVRKGDSQEPLTEGPLAELIKNPNPRESFNEIAANWMGFMEISGNAYIEEVGPDSGRDIIRRPPQELYSQRPDRMFVIPGDAKIPIAGYEYRAASAIVPYKAQFWRDPRSGGMRPRLPVMHSKYWHPLDDFYGLSPIQAASRNIDFINSAQAWNVGLMQNSARTSGVFTTDQVLTGDQVEEYTNLIRQKFSGPGNAGRPMVLGNGYKWDQISLTPAEVDWLNSLGNATDRVCAIFGLGPEIIYASSNRTYENVANARKGAYLEKWLPTADLLCAHLNRWLTPLYQDAYDGADVFIGYNKDSIEAIQEDRQLKWENAKSGTGFLMINEQRQLLNLPPIPGGDVVMVPTTSMPLSIANSSKNPALAPPPRNNQPPTDNEKPPKGKPAKKDDVSSLFRETREQLRRLQ